MVLFDHLGCIFGNLKKSSEGDWLNFLISGDDWALKSSDILMRF